MQTTVDVRAGLAAQTVLSASRAHTLAVLDDGSVAAWGNGAEGRCDVPDFGGQAAVSVAAGGSSLALLADGTMVQWGSCSVPDALRRKRAVRIAAGYFVADVSVAAFDDGSAAMWGRDVLAEWQWGSPSEQVLVARCGRHSATHCGEVLTVVPDPGEGAEPSTRVHVGPLRWLAGVQDFVMVLQDGSVRRAVKARSPIEQRGVVAASAGVFSVLLLLQSGEVQSYGSRVGVTGSDVPFDSFDGERAIAVAAGGEFSCVGLESGRVVAWGRNRCGQLAVPDWGGRRLMRP
eukprot:TRINITY_DN12498_c0_g1_i8.p1 TRINITY_DN12498_c0_g1~~TRINITY_DN12498_c0_g1_i8.p1  ORF type:complete len:289 (+),score=102.18 TRINITY_DN12498_c0_g1_i8:123-989(+)